MDKRILIIDDEVDFCATIKKVLEMQGGFDVTACLDGDSGIKTAEKLRPDIILLDIMMPGKSGVEIATILKKNHLTKDIPVVFLTGIVSSFNGRKNQQAGNGGYYLAKPTKVKDLIGVINNLT